VVENQGGKCSTSIEGKLDSDLIPRSIFFAISFSCNHERKDQKETYLIHMFVLFYIRRSLN